LSLAGTHGGESDVLFTDPPGLPVATPLVRVIEFNTRAAACTPADTQDGAETGNDD